MSRYDDHRDEADSPQPVVPATLAELLSQLAGPPDFWDRPTAGGRPSTTAQVRAARTTDHANSLYRLGSKALLRGELLQAADWLGAAAEAGHPGALFRMAALTARIGVGRYEEVRFLVAEAARHGHGDATTLLTATTGRPPGAVVDESRAEDPLFVDEVREALRLPTSINVSAPLTGTPFAAVPPPRHAPEPTPPSDSHRPPATRDKHAAATDDRVDAASRAPGSEVDCTLWVPHRTALWAPPAAPSRAPQHTPLEWESALRVLDVLALVDGTDCSITTADASRAAGVTAPAAAELLCWLSQNLLTTTMPDGTHTAGPLLQAGRRGEDVLQQVLDRLRQDTGAAVYASAYADGEITITHSAHGPDTPKVAEHVPFRECAHASAVGQSILSQLSSEERRDHLSRWRPFPLTARTITDLRALFDKVDRHGPTGSHFDVLEYSETAVCAAVSLPLPGLARCVALSLPLAQRHRLTTAARTLSDRSVGLLLAVLTASLPHERTGSPPPAAPLSTPPASEGVPLPPDAAPRKPLPPPPLHRHLTDTRRCLFVTRR
ncbi:IclR family transcriptional regulator C-terminal domain-containing protein [Streptomyces sp. DH12]|uniref:IclR family transcriptional regulator domain-containing protein n=1 Tax=Streptomyces sp. DH12 TaxID=2857010 RepID=UPI001E42D745|nr:IclR family transcriptional regulator C-terminal domain-containing protein [Streptomyces sp. DH12]